MRVSDDGVGMLGSREGGPGMGLRIMRNRAAIIGAQLTIQAAEPTGTIVGCDLERNPNA
jgi:nitrate/nitrite-specific signal transduction histidine kinase